MLFRGEGGVALSHEGGVSLGAVGGWDLLDGVDDATFKYQVPELRNKGFISVVHFVPTAVGRPC